MDDDESTAEKDSAESGSDNVGLRNMLARHNNDAMALAAELYNQTYTLREQRRSLRKENAQLKEQLPSEGAVVLTGDDAKLWESYQGLGTPQELQSKLQEAVDERRKALLTRASSKHGFKENVLRRLLGQSEIAVRETKDGEEEFVVGDGDAAKPITDLLESDWKEFAPALVAESKQGRAAVGQVGAREGGKTDYVGDYLNKVQPKPKEA